MKRICILILAAGSLLLSSVPMKAQSGEIKCSAVHMSYNISGVYVGEKDVTRSRRTTHHEFVGAVRPGSDIEVSASALSCFDGERADPLVNRISITISVETVKGGMNSIPGGEVPDVGTTIPDETTTHTAPHGSRPAGVSTGFHVPKEGVASVKVYIAYSSHMWIWAEGWAPHSVSVSAIYHVIPSKKPLDKYRNPFHQAQKQQQAQAEEGGEGEEKKEDVCPVCGGKRTTLRFKNYAGLVRYGCGQDEANLKTMSFQELLRRPAIYEGDVIYTEQSIALLIDDQARNWYEVGNNTGFAIPKTEEGSTDPVEYEVSEHFGPNSRQSVYASGLLINYRRNMEEADNKAYATGWVRLIKNLGGDSSFEVHSSDQIAGTSDHANKPGRKGGIHGTIVHFGHDATTVLAGEVEIVNSERGDTLIARAGERIVYDDENGDRLTAVDIEKVAAELGVPMEDIEHHYDKGYVDKGPALPDGASWASDEGHPEVVAAFLLKGDPDATPGIWDDGNALSGEGGVAEPGSGDGSAPSGESKSFFSGTILICLCVGGAALLLMLIVLLVRLFSRRKKDPQVVLHPRQDDIQPKKKFCKHCGAPVTNPNARFCPKCGQAL